MDKIDKKEKKVRPVTVHITNHNQFQKGVGAFITNLEHLTIVMDSEGNMKMDAGQVVAPVMPHTEVDLEKKEPSEDKAIIKLPQELSSKKAKRILGNAVELKLLTTDYQRPAGMAWWKMACMADAIGEALELSNKWVVFCEFWKNSNLRKYNTDKKGMTEYNNFRKILNSQML